ncbi:MAG: AraC family transcriptional regulator [Opitutaceae bacterium]|nr:AraC family transcriptional regulator [Opitutaceae bacterium]
MGRDPIRHGFAGQHMVVVPEPLRAAARAQALLRGLHVTDAGYFPAARAHRIERPTGAPTTLVILCLRGTGWFRLGEENGPVGPGDLIWLPAGLAHAYGAGQDPWTIAWAHFAGEEVPAWARLLNLGVTVSAAKVRLPVDRLDEIALDRVYAAIERGFSLRQQLAAATALRRSLSEVAQLAIAPTESRSARDRVLASVETLRQDWQRPRRLVELATAAGVSMTHYCTLFRHHTGFAPIDFLIRLRVQHACRLLDTTTLPVREVAERVGYSDSYYFTRCFRRVMGCSPRAYRQLQKG